MGVITALSPSQIAFFATSATVIPVLLIAFSLQLRAEAVIRQWLSVRRLRATTYYGIGAFLIAIYVLDGSGEVIALGALANDRSAGTHLVLSASALTAVFVVIGLALRSTLELVETFETDRGEHGLTARQRGLVVHPVSSFC
jgi:hypothetical protein